jgi:hypothetical protein
MFRISLLLAGAHEHIKVPRFNTERTVGVKLVVWILQFKQNILEDASQRE